jgi:nucleoside-diphosphate-sugar epimerase
MKVLLTGATGFIGSSLLRIIPDDIEIIVLTSNLTHQSYSKHNIEYIQCDMSDYKTINEKVHEKVDLCIHLAWTGNTGQERTNVRLQLKSIGTSIDLLHSLHTLNVKRFVGIGSIAEKEVIKYHLSDGSTPNPVSTYGVSKLMAHMLTKVKCNELGIEHIWCQLGNTFGPGDGTRNFINSTIDKLKTNDRASFTKGDQIYDFVYVDDAAKGIWTASTKGLSNYSYYIGSGNPCPLKNYILEMRDLISPTKPIVFGEIPYNGISLDFKDYDISPLSLMGYQPSTSFADGIKKMI